MRKQFRDITKAQEHINKPRSMEADGLLDLKFAQCVDWSEVGYACTAIQRTCRKMQRKSASALTTIWTWQQEYPTRRNPFHMGGDGRPRISGVNKNSKTTMFSEDAILSMKNAAMKIRNHHKSIWSFLRRELKLFSYKLRMYKQINDENNINRIDFAQYCHEELGTDS